MPLVLKARRHGYDGQGTVIIKSAAELKLALDKFVDTPLLIEEFIPFETELAVVIARSLTGEIKVYPTVETFQDNQVCRWVKAPYQLSAKQNNHIQTIATKLVEALDYVGVLAIELFLTSEGEVLINEVAPRTHNSGHYSLDACETSQFTLQLQAIAGKALGNTNLKSSGAVMVNLLGYESSQDSYTAKREKIASLGTNIYLHWYNKTESRVGRKLGHVTALIDVESDEDFTQKAQETIEKIESIWYPS